MLLLLLLLLLLLGMRGLETSQDHMHWLQPAKSSKLAQGGGPAVRVGLRGAFRERPAGDYRVVHYWDGVDCVLRDREPVQPCEPECGAQALQPPLKPCLALGSPITVLRGW